MILRRLHVRNYRALDDFQAEFSAGLNVVRGPNEAGKSTLQSAIVALLFSDPGLRGRGEMSVDSMRSWGANVLPTLSAEFSSPAQDYSILKDFENGRAELTLPDGAAITDRGEVGKRLADIVGLDDSDVYHDTACLRQQQWAQVASGADLKQLLQQSLTGGAEGVAVQTVLKKLDEATKNLERGVKHVAPVNPGPLARVISEREGIETDLNAARAEAGQREQARTKLQQGEQRLEELDEELRNASELKQRADRYLTLEKESGEARQRADGIDAALERVGRLDREVEALERGLAEGPQVDRALASDVLSWSERKRERTEELERDREDLREREQERKRLEAELKRVTEDPVAPEDLERAMQLQDEAEEATAAASGYAGWAADLKVQISQVERRLAPRPYLIGIGLVAAVGGLALGLLVSPLLYALAAGGAIILAWGLLLRAPEDWRDLPAQFEQAQADQQAQEERARINSEASQAALSAAGCETIKELAGKITAQEGLRAETATRLENARANIAERQEKIEQAESVIRALQDKLQDALETTGFDSVGQLVERADAREKARRDMRDKQQKRKGALGDETPESLEAKSREFGRTWRARQDELESPELASARLSPQDYQALLSRLQDLEQEREGLTAEIREAEQTMAAARHDADTVRALEGDLQRLLDHQSLLEERLEVRNLARDVIAEAQQQTLAAATAAIGPRIGELMSKITDERYCEVVLDGDSMTPAVTHPATDTPIALTQNDAGLSCATREQAFLTARLAIVDMLWPEGGPPLLLDDPLVNFDPDRRQAALETIQSAAETHQVILFTCAHDYDFAAARIIEMPGPES